MSGEANGKLGPWLFKSNDVSLKYFVKISNINISSTPIFFVEKLLEALQKLLSFFQQKYLCIW